MKIERIHVLGVGVSGGDAWIALDASDEWISRDEPNYTCVTGVHGIMESYRKGAVRRDT